MGKLQDDVKERLDGDFLSLLFPPGRDDEFFEALYGGAEDGAFDIRLTLEGVREEAGEVVLAFTLTERPGKCMACSLTYGLPPVFERHPIINLKGILDGVSQRLAPDWKVEGYKIGATAPKAPKVNIIPLAIQVAPA